MPEESPVKPDGATVTEEFQGVSFKVVKADKQVTISPSGLTGDNSPVSAALNGSVKSIEVADINADGSPEIYIFTTEDGAEKRAGLIAFSANNKKSLSAIFLPPIEDDKANAEGYRGQDEMAVVEGIIARRFPIYASDPGQLEPTGKIRQLQYKLTPGEAGWLLKLDQSLEF